MPDPVQSNPRDAIAFEKDFGDVFTEAQNADALDFAAQFDAPASASAPPVEAAPAGAPGAVERAAVGTGRDVALGVLNAPRSALRGARNGVQNIVDFGYELDKYFNTPALQVFNEKGEFDLDLVRVGDAAKKGVEPLAQLPEIDKPKIQTITGDLIEGLSQFAVGFKGVDKAFKASTFLSGGEKAIRGLKGGKLGVNVVKGALADLAAFDEKEQRLSNLVQDTPLANPVAEYLQADDDDSFAEGKLKQAIEGLALGGVADVLLDSVKLLKRGKSAKAALEDAADNPERLFMVPDEEAAGVGVEGIDFEFLGPSGSDELFMRKQRKLDDAADEVEGAFGKTKRVGQGAAETIDDYEINFSRIEGPDDIKRLIDDMVNNPALKSSIEDARRGTRDARETLRAATDIDGFDSLLERRQGDAFNAETIVAARKVYYDTTEKLMEAAKRAAGPEASAIDQFNFRKMVATHHAVQKEFMGVRAEAGRALQAWSIPVGGSGAENARALEQVLNEFGGLDASQDLARRITSKGNALNTSQLNAITQKAASARTMDAMTEVWTLGLLTNPTTHVVNLTSNVFTGLLLGAERFGAALVKDSPVSFREGSEFFVGIMESQKAAMKNAAEAWRTGQTGIGLSKLDLPRTRNTARDILDPDGKAGIFSKALDGYGALLSKYAGGALAAGDEYQKTVLYQAQVRALAVREGIAQGLDSSAIKAHVANKLADPSPNIRADALDFANYGTFTKELGKTGQDIQRVIARNPALRFVVPFVRTPINIFKFTYERTPLAPLSQKVRADIQAGGVRKAAALSKIGMGTSVLAIGNDLAMNGHITGSGPSDPDTRSALRRTGWQPYSVKIGDTYYSYARLDPLATVLGMSADMAEILSNYEAYDIDAQKEADNLVLAGAIAAANQVVGKTFLSGFADLVEVLADPGRNGSRYTQRFAGSVVPAGVAALERSGDPALESVFTMMDAVKARIPGMSASVPNRKNIWGEDIQTFYPDGNMAAQTAERLMSLVNPIYYSAAKDSPVDRWMLKNGFEIRMPQKVQRFEGVKIDLRDFPAAYARLVELRGNGLELSTYGNQTMKSFFENLASEEDPFGRHISFFMAFGNSYEDQQNFVNHVVGDYTEGAREQLLEEFPELGDRILAQRRNANILQDVRPPIQEGDVQ